MRAFDVAVVGAGVTGASAAFHLASRGADTVIFERDFPAAGPTGRSTALCRAYYTNKFLARVAHESIQMFERFPEITMGRDAAFRRTGMLILHPFEDVERVREQVSMLNRVGVTTDLLELDDLAERFPAFDLHGVGVGAFEVNAGHADPTFTTMGLYRRAVELGLVARMGSCVSTIRPDGRAWSITTRDGAETSCSRILIAVGPWTRPLAAQVGADLPLTVEREIVVTFAWGEAEPVIPHIDLVGGYSLRGEGTELYLVDPLLSEPNVDPDDYPEEVGDDEISPLAEAVMRRVPHLAASEMRRGWASLYDVSPDWQPVIGEIAPGIFVNAGTSGHGFKLAPALGRHVAELVLGEATDPGLAQFHPRRFEEGRSLPAGYGKVRVLG